MKTEPLGDLSSLLVRGKSPRDHCFSACCKNVPARVEISNSFDIVGDFWLVLMRKTALKKNFFLNLQLSVAESRGSKTSLAVLVGGIAYSHSHVNRSDTGQSRGSGMSCMQKRAECAFLQVSYDWVELAGEWEFVGENARN